MAHPTVAAQLLRMLRDAGARRIYGVVGDSLNPVVDAVRHTDGIEWVHVSNEEGGAFAAAAEAQITGQLAVCAGSCGPGNTHLIQGLYDAHRSGAPVVAIASHIQSQEIGMGFLPGDPPGAHLPGLLVLVRGGHAEADAAHPARRDPDGDRPARGLGGRAPR